MFYEPDKKNHGLRFTPYKSLVIPRPIGWISTLSLSGAVNLAPFSQFNNVGYDPGYLMFSAGGQHPDGRRKDSLINAEDTGEFVFNVATYELRSQVHNSAQIVDSSVDEMKALGLTPVPSTVVKPPRVAESPINVECRYYTTLVLPGHDHHTNHHLVIGRVVGVHIRDDLITPDGKIDVLKLRPLARLGYVDYTTVESLFSLEFDDAVRDGFMAGMSGER
jgi:flavin reductase (DIM6/NTAB) family NADH-FMN oxidoreductase RutF